MFNTQLLRQKHAPTGAHNQLVPIIGIVTVKRRAKPEDDRASVVSGFFVAEQVGTKPGAIPEIQSHWHAGHSGSSGRRVMSDLEQQAKSIIDGVGGKSNVEAVVHCATRLRFTLKDDAKADKAAVQKVAGVVAVVQSGGQFQVVIGNTVPDSYEAVVKELDMRAEAQVEADATASAEDAAKARKANIRKKNTAWLNAIIQLVSSLFNPLLSAMVAGGMLKGLTLVLVKLGWVSTDSGNYLVLNAAGDAVFYFLPMLLAFTAAKRFKADPFVAVVLAGGMIYPTVVAAASSGTSITLLGLPVPPISYASTVIPIVLAVYVMSWLERWLKSWIHSSIRPFLVPMICIGVMLPAVLLIVGPIANNIALGLGAGYKAVFGFAPWLAGGVFGGLWQVFVIFGVHWGLVPVILNNVTTFGQDSLLAAVTPAVFAQAGAALGVFLKTRDTQLKAIAAGAALSGIFGITEPAIYGVNLRFGRPFITGVVFGTICGAIVVVAGCAAYVMAVPGLLTMPIFLGPDTGTFLIMSAMVAVAYFGTAIVTYLFSYNDSMLEAEKQRAQTAA
ncbi:PTS transporter subunit EIIC [Consotaella aegiceratis]|uniref:PTS transporter subunit EIIC n=1 Tax=Consotaella aegiceratis TaxID=3097961 RepID=UPI002F404233